MRAVRSSSEFNFSMITIIFDDDIDFYFARQRVTEKLGQASTFLPAGRGALSGSRCDGARADLLVHGRNQPRRIPIDPGQALGAQQVLHRPATERRRRAWPMWRSSAARRSNTRSTSVPRTCGPTALHSASLYAAVGKSNMPAGGGVMQKNNAEYIVRGVGWIKDKGDIENTVIKEVNGTPIYVKNVATVQLGTQFRRSVYEKDGNEVIGGVVLMRHGENPLAVTERVKEKIQELQPGLPEGVHIVAAYDRTRLIHGAIHTLTRSHVARNGDRLGRGPADPDALSQRVRHLRHAAAGGAVLVSDDVGPARHGHHRHSGQHHVVGRHHDLDRHPGRSGDRDDGERHAPSQGPFRRQESHGRHPRAGDRALPHRRPADFLLGA